ncbi:hypothetical protein WOLCODRAFT_17674 [Wolfiporia cocos MD-104 SS10]|uniref:Uncharacterized protein n=1 Tax=Wolfiporia cocos (strain MD-104) TaxID=742152 RepID=A0A2H3JR49_WOLCO|nr:hypothetical protein WOLCODRAFT_17674 [Wolfiporia cocos MD-104 SS10]
MAAVAMYNSAPEAAYEFTSYPYRRYDLEEFDYRQMFGPHEVPNFWHESRHVDVTPYFDADQWETDNVRENPAMSNVDWTAEAAGYPSMQAVWFPDQSQPMIPVSYGRRHGDFNLPSQALLERLILEIPEYGVQVWQVGGLRPKIIIDVSWDCPEDPTDQAAFDSVIESVYTTISNAIQCALRTHYGRELLDDVDRSTMQALQASYEPVWQNWQGI